MTVREEMDVEAEEARRDLLIKNLWNRGTNCVIDVRVTDLEEKYNTRRTSEKDLMYHEKLKRKKYGDKCKERQLDITPFIILADGMLAKEADAVLKRLAERLTLKWGRPYSPIISFMKSRLNTAIIKATHLCLRGSQVPYKRICSPMCVRINIPETTTSLTIS